MYVLWNRKINKYECDSGKNKVLRYSLFWLCLLLHWGSYWGRQLAVHCSLGEVGSVNVLHYESHSGHLLDQWRMKMILCTVPVSVQQTFKLVWGLFLCCSFVFVFVWRKTGRVITSGWPAANAQHQRMKQSQQEHFLYIFLWWCYSLQNKGSKARNLDT